MRRPSDWTLRWSRREGRGGRVLLYAPPPATPGPYVAILENDGVDVLVANTPESASLLLENATPAFIFAIVPVLGEELRETFRKRAPRAELRVFPSLAALLEESIVSPREAFDFAVRAIVATAGVLSAARGTPRERSARILKWSEKAATALGFTAAEVAAVRLAAALFDVPGALTGQSDESEDSEESEDRKRDRAIHRSLLGEFISGVGAPFGIEAPDVPPAQRPPAPIEVVEAAAELGVAMEGKVRSPIVSLRRLASAGELHPGAVEAVIAAGAAAQGTIRRGRIVIIDSDAGSRNVLALRLANEGYETETAADGRAALEMIRRSAPSLIVSESVLPGLDGYALLDTLRREGHARIPFVFVSSRSDALSMNKGLLLGAADFLAKPVNIEVLLTKMQKLLGQELAAKDVSSRIALSDVSATEAFDTISYDHSRRASPS